MRLECLIVSNHQTSKGATKLKIWTGGSRLAVSSLAIFYAVFSNHKFSAYFQIIYIGPKHNINIILKLIIYACIHEINYNSNCIFIYCLLVTLQANGEAALGQYRGGVAGAAAGQSLFVKCHTY